MLSELGILDYLTTRTSLSSIRCGFAPGFVNYKKGSTRLAVESDKTYQLLAHDLWFSPGTPASFTTKTGHHDIAEILLKVALKHQKSKKNLNLTNIDMFTREHEWRANKRYKMWCTLYVYN